MGAVPRPPTSRYNRRTPTRCSWVTPRGTDARRYQEVTPYKSVPGSRVHAAAAGAAEGAARSASLGQWRAEIKLLRQTAPKPVRRLSVLLPPVH